MVWRGPYQITKLLRQINLRPPEENGIYLISRKMWRQEPSIRCFPLYIGSNSGRVTSFRMRIGDLIADMFGFYGTDEVGHHSGAQRLHEYCLQENISPKQLYIGWTEGHDVCLRCAENQYYDSLTPLFNMNRPERCRQHTKPRKGQKKRGRR